MSIVGKQCSALVLLVFLCGCAQTPTMPATLEESGTPPTCRIPGTVSLMDHIDCVMDNAN